MNFLSNNPLYVVGIIAAVVWLGIFIFMLGIERRVKVLESRAKQTSALNEDDLSLRL